MVWKTIGFYRVQPSWYQRNIANRGLLMAYCGYHQIGKLRGNANLRYLYTGEQKAKGRRKRYDGKMVVGDISRLTFVGKQTVYRAL